MLSTLPQKFFGTGECGCGNVQPYQPAYPCNGATICDPRYLTLTIVPVGQLVVVPQGSQCQAFLGNATPGFRGIMLYEGGSWNLTNAPALTLPLLNPPVDGAYPVPSGWKYLQVGTSEPAQWKHLAAPTAGTWILQVKNGSWELVDAGTIPGINEIGQSGLTTVKGKVMTLVELTPGVWSVRTLVVGHHRVLVGDVDGITGLTGHKSLPDADDLEHPKAKITAMRFYTLETLDLAGNSIAGGLEQAIVTGVGAVTDGVRMIYSPTLKRLFKAPPHSNSFVAVNSASGSFTPGVSYGAIPAGHGAGVSHNYNYSNVRIDFNLGSTADEAYQLGLFRDGTLLQEWNNLAILDTMTVFYNDVAVVPGAHTYDIRIKKTTGTNALNVRQSFFMISTAQG